MNQQKRFAELLVLLLFVALIGVQPTSAAEKREVNVYTDRQEVFLKPLFELFEQQTGIHVNSLFVKKGVLEKLRIEGESSPADVLIFLDIAKILKAVDSGLIAPLDDDHLRGAIPAALRDPDNHWFAMTIRPRIIYADADADVGSLARYENMADAEWAKQICIRDLKHNYNVGLLADIYNRIGANAFDAFLNGFVDNLARRPKGKDRTQIKSVIAGECRLGVANLYYYFGMLQKADDDERAKLESLQLVLPKPTHVNITAMMLAKNHRHSQEAKALMRFLVSDVAQRHFAEHNGEFPVQRDVTLPPLLEQYRERAAVISHDWRAQVEAKKIVAEYIDRLSN